MASNNPLDYIHPIIRAFIEDREFRARQGQLAFENEQRQKEFAERQKDREMQTKLLEENIRETVRQRDEMAKIKAEQQKLQEREKSLKALEEVRKLRTMGVDIGKLPLFKVPEVTVEDSGGMPLTIPGTPTDQITVPGFGNIPVSAFPTPEQEAERIKNLSLAKDAGSFQRAIIASTDKRNQQSLLHDLGIKKIESAEKIAKNRDATVLEATKLRTEGAKDIARMKVNAKLEPEDLTDVSGFRAKSLIDGQIQYQNIPAKERKEVEARIQDMGFVIPPKEVFKTLNNFLSLKDNIRVFEEIVPMLATTKLGGTAVGLKTKLAEKVGYPTDLSVKIKQQAAQAGKIAKSAFFGSDVGNLAVEEVERALGALAKPNITQAQARERLKDLKNAINNGFVAVLKSRGIPPQQIEYYRNNYDAKKLSGKIYDLEMSMKLGRPVYREE